MATLNDYKVATKNLERKLEERKLLNTTVSRKFLRLNNKLAEVKTEKTLLKDTTEEMMESSVREKKVESKSCDKILKSVEPELAGLSMNLSRSTV